MTTPSNIIIRSVYFLILTVHQIYAFQVPPNNRLKIDEILEFRIPRAEKLRAFMNESVDPCFDFYEFACGKWTNYYPATENTPITSPMIDLEDTVNKELQVLLEENVKSTDGQVGRKVKDFYWSCMDSLIASQSIKQVFTDFIKSNSGMPAIAASNWNERKYDWVTQISNLRRQYGMDILIGVNIKNGQIYIGEASTMIPKRICKEANLTNIRYYELKTEITDNMFYWFEMDTFESSNFATEVLHFETYLCRGMSEELGPDVFPNITKMSLTSLNSMFPKIKFSDIVTTSFEHAITQPIFLEDKQYFDHLSSLVQDTPKKFIANYIMYRALNAISFPEEYNREKRASLCVEECVKHFPKDVGAMYHTRNYLPETREDLEQIKINLIQAFKTDIDSQLWISGNTRKEAIKKINKMELMFPNYLPEFMFQEYGTIKIDRKHFWKNILNLLKLEQTKENKKLFSNYNNKEVEPFNIYAEYSAVENKIRMPLGLLQPPVYHWTAPNAFKFGILGYIIARELINGMDENGWVFDDASAMRLWWDLNSTLEYKLRAACFRDQYVSYAGDNLSLSPAELDENIREIIADNGALNISFNAYLEWLEKTIDPNILYDETFSDVDYTNTQLFFISYAQNFCTATYKRDEPIGFFPWDTPNYLEKFKVNGVLWNMKEFSREFNCLPGSEMNPGDKCSIF